MAAEKLKRWQWGDVQCLTAGSGQGTPVLYVTLLVVHGPKAAGRARDREATVTAGVR